MAFARPRCRATVEQVKGWTAGTVTGVLRAYYAQLELHPGEGGRVLDLDDLGLVTGAFADSEYATLTTARQDGALEISIEVRVTAAPTEPAWDAAVEFSLVTGDSLALTGWASEGRIPVDVPSGVEVRVRYVVLDGQRAADQERERYEEEDEAGPERYLLQLWPAPATPARVIASTAPWSHYWTFGPPAAALVQELADVPDPDRLTAVVDRALAAHPDVTKHLRAGDARYEAGIIRYLQELFRVTHASGVYGRISADYRGLSDLIEERARLQPEGPRG